MLSVNRDAVRELAPTQSSTGTDAIRLWLNRSELRRIRRGPSCKSTGARPFGDPECFGGDRSIDFREVPSTGGLRWLLYFRWGGRGYRYTDSTFFSLQPLCHERNGPQAVRPRAKALQ
jgi:hypothetical protein